MQGRELIVIGDSGEEAVEYQVLEDSWTVTASDGKITAKRDQYKTILRIKIGSKKKQMNSKRLLLKRIVKLDRKRANLVARNKLNF